MTAADLLAKVLNPLPDGDSQEALEALTTAIQLDLEFAEAYAYRGLAFYHQSDYDAAVEDYDKAVALCLPSLRSTILGLSFMACVNGVEEARPWY